MPKLPGAEDLGNPVSGRSGRPIATVDTTAIGRGIATLGQGMRSLAADLSTISEKNKTEVDQSARFETQRRFLEFSAKEDDELQSAGQKAQPGAFGFREGFQESYKQRAKEFLATVPEELKPEYDVRLFQAEDSLAGRALTFEREARKGYYTNTVNDGLTLIENKLYSNPSAFDANLKEGNEFIDSIPDEDVSPIAKEAMRREWRRKAQIASLNGLPPKARAEALGMPAAALGPLPADVQGRAAMARDHFVKLGYTPEQAAGIVGNLVQESGVRADGPSGDNGTAFGVAQWRGERLTRLKRFANANGANWQDLTTQLNFIDMELKNHETGAYEALKNAKTIDEATAAFIGYERPQGWSTSNPRGGHGWSNRLAAAQRAAGVAVNVQPGEVAPQYADIPWDEREKVISGAETEMRQEQAEQRVSAQFAIENAITNAPIAIQNTSEYIGAMPTQDQFIAAYGDQAIQKFKEFQQAIETSRTAYGMQTMPAEEIQSLVKDAQPDSSGDDAALQQERYEVLSKAADATMKAREDDPASYVRRVFPTIDSAWKGIDTQAGYASAVTLSIAAQERLGITDIKPLPKEAAELSVETFKDVNKSENERFSAVATALVSTPDPAQRRAIFEQLVDAGLPDITEGAVEALSRGDTGAARRLFQAAVVDPSKLPGASPEKPAVIDEAIQSALMDQGQIGDIYYGLSDGSAENFVRAERDSKLLFNAVNLRLRSGEELEDAVNSAAKDLYGDLQVVDSAGNLNAQVLIPADQDASAVSAGLAALEPKVKEAIDRALVVPGSKAGPSIEPKGLLEPGNIDLESRPQVKNADGSISTVRSMSFEQDGKEVLVPTVSPDGKILSNEDAIKLYRETGKHLGKFDTPEDATAYAEALHDAQESFYRNRSDGTKAILNAATSNYAENVIAKGYFRNSGDGFVFIDPYLGAAIADKDGNPVIFTLKDVLAAGATDGRPKSAPGSENTPMDYGLGGNPLLGTPE